MSHGRRHGRTFRYRNPFTGGLAVALLRVTKRLPAQLDVGAALSVWGASVAVVIRVPVQVDVAGAVEIARAAAAFEWTWSRGDTARFVGAVRWAEPVALGDFPEMSLVARVPVAAWDSSAIFSHGDGELRQVHVVVSDCPQVDGDRTPELLAAAAAEVSAGLTQVFGMPAAGPIGIDHGLVWEAENVVIGVVTSRSKVELVLVNPSWQRWWENCHQRRVARRAGLTEWDRFAESLAECLQGMYEDCPMVLHMRGGRDVQIFKCPPGGARIFENAERFYVEIGTPDPDDPEWEFDPEDTDDATAVYESDDYPEPLDITGYSRLAVRIATDLKAVGARSPHDVMAHDWVTNPGPTEIIPLRPADDLPPRSRSSDPREVLEIQLDHEWRSDSFELDVPGALAVVRDAASFGWTWTEGDVKRFAAHAGWNVYTARTVEDKFWASAGRDRHAKQAIFQLDGDRLTGIDIAISTDLCDNDLEDEGYDFLNRDLDQAYALALNGFREALGEPRHGTLDGMYLFWELGGITIAPIRAYGVVNLRICSTAQRERTRPTVLRATAVAIANAAWEQLAEDVAAIVAEGIPVGSGLVVGGGVAGFVRFTSRSGTLHLEFGAPDLADEGWHLNDRLAFALTVYQRWTPPDESFPNWRIQLPPCELFRDYLHFVEHALSLLRDGQTLAPQDLKPRLEEVN